MRNIQYVVGDLLKAPEPVIVHGCNAQGVMGSGVALAIRDAFPTVYRRYNNVIEKHKNTTDPVIPGDVIFAYVKGKVFANCITQKFYGRQKLQYVDYNAIRECMKRIDKLCCEERYTAVAMPKIGAGLGGGNWQVISEIIQETMFCANPVVYVLNREDMPQDA